MNSGTSVMHRWICVLVIGHKSLLRLTFTHSLENVLVMAYDLLALALRNTLLEEGHVTLPRLGQLELEYHPARLDRQRAVLSPPAKWPAFTMQPENIRIQEGLVTSYHASALHLDPLGTRSLEADVQAIASLILEGESVELNEVGNFSQKGDGSIDFQPSPFNYYLEVYGLDEVEAVPIRKRTAAQAASEALEARSARPKTPPVKVYTWKDKLFLPVAATVLLIAMGTALWLILRPSGAQETAEVIQPQPIEETEKTFSEDDLRTGSDVIEQPDLLDSEPEEENNEVVADPPPPQTPPPSSSGPEVTIVVGHFGDPNNASRVLERLEGMGLSGEAVPRGSLTRVVVHVPPSLSQEVLTTIRSNFDKAAWIIK